MFAADFFFVTPASDGVEIFETETDDVHLLVTGSTGGSVLVEEDHLAIGHRLVGGGGEFGDVGWGRGGFVVEDFFHDEGTANDGGGALAVGTSDEKGGLGEEAPAVGSGGEFHFLEGGIAGIFKWEAVVIGQGSVDHDEVGVDEVFGGKVFSDEGAKKFADFLLCVLLDSFVELVVLFTVDGDGIEAFEVGPLADEAIAEGLGARVGDQAVDLLGVDAGA